MPDGLVPCQKVIAASGRPDRRPQDRDSVLRYRVDLGYRWIFEPYHSDLVVRLDKGYEVFRASIEKVEED